MARIVKRRVGQFTSIFLITIALCIDLLQIILNLFAVGLIANKFITIITAFAVILFLLLKNIPLVSNPKIFLMLTGAIAGEALPLPLLDSFFFWTLALWGILRTVKKEDDERIRQAEAEREAEEVRLRNQQIMQMNLRNNMYPDTDE